MSDNHYKGRGGEEGGRPSHVYSVTLYRPYCPQGLIRSHEQPSKQGHRPPNPLGRADYCLSLDWVPCREKGGPCLSTPKPSFRGQGLNIDHLTLFFIPNCCYCRETELYGVPYTTIPDALSLMCRVAILHSARIPIRLAARLGVLNHDLVLRNHIANYGYVGKCIRFPSEPRIGQIHLLLGRLSHRDSCSMPSKGNYACAP
jgi:hypothetical protein